MADAADAGDLANERARLLEIGRLDLLRPSLDPALDEIVRKAAERLGTEIALVSIVLDMAQVFVASHGLQGWLAEVGGTPIEWSFCRNAVESRSPFVVDDAEHDPRVAGNPLVEVDGIRCYAGVPLITDGGHAVGTLCAMGFAPHSFDEDALAVLHVLGASAVDRIESRRAA